MAYQEYTKTIWQNDNPPAINADNLNKIEDGIAANNEDVIDLNNRVTEIKTASDQHETDITSLEEKTTQHDTDIQALQTDVSANKEDIASLKTESTSTSDAITELQRSKADAIVETASGESLHVEDASGNALHNLKVFGKATQDGTPSSENPANINVAGSSGGIEVSILNSNILPNLRRSDVTSVGIKYRKNDDGSVNLSGTSTGYIGFLDSASFILKKGSYRLGLTGLNVGTEQQISAQIRSTDGLTTYANSSKNDGKFILTANVEVVFRIIVGSENIQASGTYYPILNVGENLHDFEPYTSQTFTLSTPNGLPGIPVKSGGNYTDETGQQWISDVIDCKSKKYNHNIQIFVLNGENISIRNVIVSPSTTGRFSLALPSFGVGRAKFGKEFLCDRLEPTFGADVTEAGKCNINDQGYILIFVSASITTVEQLKTYCTQNPITFVYPLAEPYETDLSAEEIAAYKALHTNKTVTNVYSDTDQQVGIQMDYGADTKTYIDKKFEAMTASVLKIESEVK